MIKIDLNKVCCFSLLCANLYSPSGLFRPFWLPVPSSAEVDWPLRTLRRQYMRLLSHSPTLPSSAFHSNWPNISLSQISVHFEVRLLCYGFNPPRHSYVYFILLCVNFSASVVLWLEEYINSNIPLRSQIQVANY